MGPIDYIQTSIRNYLRCVTPKKSADLKIQGLCVLVVCCAVDLISSVFFWGGDMIHVFLKVGLCSKALISEIPCVVMKV